MGVEKEPGRSRPENQSADRKPTFSKFKVQTALGTSISFKQKPTPIAAARPAPQFDGAFDYPGTGSTEQPMEGLDVRTEAGGRVAGHAPRVQPEFVEQVKQSEYRQHPTMASDELAEGAEIGG